MPKPDYPTTAAVRFLRRGKVAFEPCRYRYAGGGARLAAASLELNAHTVVKILVMEDEHQNPLMILMHGDREVSTKALARQVGKKQITPCQPSRSEKLTGYQVGGISPFGTRKPLPVYVEASIFELPIIYINGGKRGFLVKIAPDVLQQALPVTLVSVAIRR